MIKIIDSLEKFTAYINNHVSQTMNLYDLHVHLNIAAYPLVSGKNFYFNSRYGTVCVITFHTMNRLNTILYPHDVANIDDVKVMLSPDFAKELGI